MSMLFLSLLFCVRPVDPIAAQALDIGLARSAVIRGLIQTLDASNVIVHVESSRQMPAGIGGTTRFVTSRGAHRYLRITISAELSTPARIAMLAHELQHACEVAASNADDAAGLRGLFLQRGHRDGEYFETAAAMLIERTVRKELRAVPEGVASRTANSLPVK